MSRYAPRVFAVLVIVALATTGAVKTQELRRLAAGEDDRIAAVAAARQEVTGLLSVNSETSKADLQTLLDGATSEFRDEFADQASAFLKSLRQGRVVSTGEVTSAGIAAIDDDSATVLVAASGTVENDTTDAPEPRYYRLLVDLEKVRGRWLVANLEFVP